VCEAGNQAKYLLPNCWTKNAKKVTLVVGRSNGNANAVEIRYDRQKKHLESVFKLLTISLVATGYHQQV